MYFVLFYVVCLLRFVFDWRLEVWFKLCDWSFCECLKYEKFLVLCYCGFELIDFIVEIVCFSFLLCGDILFW